METESSQLETKGPNCCARVPQQSSMFCSQVQSSFVVPLT